MKKIILTVLIVLLVAAGGLAFFLLSGNKEKDRSFNYDPGEYFVTDIADSERLLKADIIIRMSDKRKEKFYSENNHRIRSVVIRAIRGRSENELKGSGAQGNVSDDIIRMLNTEFESDEFLQIFYNEFVIQ
ncbi:MAG: hypothetical protein GX153_04350 [Clostridiaceae bacterium]|nr:hypothetical protein [Clostridiaceae bacterium]